MTDVSMASNKMTAQYDPYQEMETYLEKVAVSIQFIEIFSMEKRLILVNATSFKNITAKAGNNSHVSSSA